MELRDAPLGTSRYWSPLRDDGDALRLAVKLGFRIEHDFPGRNSKVMVQARYSDEVEKNFGTSHQWFKEFHDADPCAATRRAIVRAAAEIGRRMP